MNDDRKQLSELFGIVKFDGDDSSDPSTLKKKKGKSAEESKKLGEAALEAGQAELALEHLRRAVEQSDSASAAKVDLAVALEMTGEEEQATDILLETIATDADCAEARIALADIYRRQSQFQAAIDQLERAVATQPTNPQAHFKLAEVCRDAKFDTAAIQAAERAALVDPTNSFYHYWLADLLIEKKLFAEALEPLKLSHELSPGDDGILLKSAIAFWGAGKRDQAQKAVRLASELDPDRKLYLALEIWFKNQVSPGSEAPIELDRYEQDQLERIQKNLAPSLKLI